MNSFVYFVPVVCVVGVICFIDFSELFWVSNFSSGCDCVADWQWYIAEYVTPRSFNINLILD